MRRWRCTPSYDDVTAPTAIPQGNRTCIDRFRLRGATDDRRAPHNQAQASEPTNERASQPQPVPITPTFRYASPLGTP